MRRTTSNLKLAPCAKFEPEKWRQHTCKNCLQSRDSHTAKAQRGSGPPPGVPAEPFPLAELPEDLILDILTLCALKVPETLGILALSQKDAFWRKLANFTAKTRFNLPSSDASNLSSDTTNSGSTNYIRKLWEDSQSFPIWECEKCNYRLCGLRCCGYRSPQQLETWNVDEDYRGYSPKLGVSPSDAPVPSGCGILLKYNKSSHAVYCTEHPQNQVFVRCNCSDMDHLVICDAKLNQKFTATIMESVHRTLKRHVSDESPMVTCTACGWSVEGMLCAKHYKPAYLTIEGFYERVWCSYVWACPECNDTKGVFASGTCFCSCQGPGDWRGRDAPGTAMLTLNYEERHFPPSN